MRLMSNSTKIVYNLPIRWYRSEIYLNTPILEWVLPKSMRIVMYEIGWTLAENRLQKKNYTTIQTDSAV